MKLFEITAGDTVHYIPKSANFDVGDDASERKIVGKIVNAMHAQVVRDNLVYDRHNIVADPVSLANGQVDEPWLRLLADKGLYVFDDGDGYLIATSRQTNVLV